MAVAGGLVAVRGVAHTSSRRVACRGPRRERRADGVRDTAAMFSRTSIVVAHQSQSRLKPCGVLCSSCTRLAGVPSPELRELSSLPSTLDNGSAIRTWLWLVQWVDRRGTWAHGPGPLGCIFTTPDAQNRPHTAYTLSCSLWSSTFFRNQQSLKLLLTALPLGF